MPRTQKTAPVTLDAPAPAPRKRGRPSKKHTLAAPVVEQVEQVEQVEVAPAPAPAPAPESPASIRTRAMLVNCSVHEWEGRIKDEDVTEQAHKHFSIAAEMGGYRKHLVPKSTLEKLHICANAIRTCHQKYTLAWDNKGGTRILSSKAFPEYNAKMRSLLADYQQVFKDELEAVKPSGLTGYEEAKIQAKALLNGAWRESDYPALETLRGKFGADITILPLPSGEDFRIDLGDEMTKQIQEQITERSNLQVMDAMKGLYERLHEVVSRLSRTLRQEKTELIRQTLLETITSVLDSLPLLNITNDAKLDAFAADIRALVSGVTAKTLRETPAQRDQVAHEADAILAKMADFLG